jgi:hypothetical protein
MTPYDNLDQMAFWAPAVAQRHMLDISGLWQPKFAVAPEDRVVTYGSCFAQHFGRALAARGWSWHDAEPQPQPMSDADAKRFNYGVFSSRTGNIYTVSLLRQWLGWAFDGKPAPDEIWEKAGRFHDPFRPRIEPDGFASADEALASRDMTIEAFGRSVREAKVFVFTLGLTECWFNTARGYEYPMCPGTVAGTFDAEHHHFINQKTGGIIENLTAAIQILRRENPKVRVLLTVSPVPLTATASGQHVLVATMRSKSVLRAAAAEVAESFDFVDYFPSYEIIASPPFRGTFFEPNLRGVNPAGVAHVMSVFFAAMGQGQAAAPEPQPEPAEMPRRLRRLARQARQAKSDDLVCEEELLAAFQK